MSWAIYVQRWPGGVTSREWIALTCRLGWQASPMGLSFRVSGESGCDQITGSEAVERRDLLVEKNGTRLAGNASTEEEDLKSEKA